MTHYPMTQLSVGMLILHFLRTGDYGLREAIQQAYLYQSRLLFANQN